MLHRHGGLCHFAALQALILPRHNLMPGPPHLLCGGMPASMRGHATYAPDSLEERW
jgi:hypothetical protein